jgi:putative DNA primase/helicase
MVPELKDGGKAAEAVSTAVDSIPLELKARPQWLTWKYAGVDGDRKMPLCHDGTAGRSNSPKTWCGFDNVKAFDKIAFVIDGSDPYCGIDLDGCIVDGEFKPWATEILEQFRGVSYGEISPSGSGVKLLTNAKKPQPCRCTHKFSDEAKEQVE